MNKEKICLIEQEIRKLPLVRWDRFFDTGESITVFGWINREDFHKDFVVLFWEHPINDSWGFGYATSSAVYSKEIARLLGIEGHVDCQRVEDIIDLENVVKLRGKNEENK